MSNDPTTTALSSRLRALCEIVSAEAARNPEFSRALEEVLLSAEVKVKIQAKKSKSSKPNVNTVHILQQGGEEALAQALAPLTTDDIRKLITADRYARLKEVKDLDRESLISILVGGTHKRLHQGAVFIKSG